jgi:hypothetical protein
MAAIATIFGGLVGYVLAILAYYVVGTGLMSALLVWSLGGIGFVVLALVVSRLSRRAETIPAQA